MPAPAVLSLSVESVKAHPKQERHIFYGTGKLSAKTNLLLKFSKVEMMAWPLENSVGSRKWS